jgi:hypothetical protein
LLPESQRPIKHNAHVDLSALLSQADIRDESETGGDDE